MAKVDMAELLERTEIIQKLVDNGYGDFVNAILDNEKKAFTRRARINKSSCCRLLGWSTKKLDDTLKACRELLEDDFE